MKSITIKIPAAVRSMLAALAGAAVALEASAALPVWARCVCAGVVAVAAGAHVAPSSAVVQTVTHEIESDWT